jgi:BlaI family transcriptional regulator, penicillinase repressor
MSDPSTLSRRERQIMEIVYARSTPGPEGGDGGSGGGATANDVMADLPDPPTRTSIRTILRILEQKGHLTHTLEGREFVYRPVASRDKVGRSALQTVIRAFFGDSLPNALAAYIADPGTPLSAEDLKRLRALIRQAKERGQ